MNFKLVLKTYSQLRQLTDDETALLNTLRGMSESERELFAEALAPEKPVKSSKSATKRKIEKCGVEGCGLTRRAVLHKDSSQAGYHVFNDPNGHAQVKAAGKSKRAESLAEKIQGKARPASPEIGGFANDTDMQACVNCGRFSDENIHHLKTAQGYHPFVSSSTAPPATQLSPTNGDGASIETGSEDVSDAVHAVRGGGE